MSSLESYQSVVKRFHGEQPSDVPESLQRMRRGPVRRRTPPRLRVFFLRQLRICGEVTYAAKRTAVALSTLYRWRDRDPRFAKRWDDLLAQRRQMIEDRLMSTVLEGEQVAMYYQGKEVGWQRRFTHRPAVRALDYFDAREAAEKIRHSASRSAAAASPEKPRDSGT